MSDSLRLHGLYRPWNSPDQNTGVGHCSLLQGIFPAQGSNPGLPHCRQILSQLSHKGSPFICYHSVTRQAPLSMELSRQEYWSGSVSSVAQWCQTLCDPMNHSTPGLLVHHHLLEFTQTHVHRVSDAMQPSQVVPFSSEFFAMSQLFTLGGQSTGVSALASFLPKKSQG